MTTLLQPKNLIARARLVKNINELLKNGTINIKSTTVSNDKINFYNYFKAIRFVVKKKKKNAAIKLTPVLYASVLLSMLNFIIALSKFGFL